MLAEQVWDAADRPESRLWLGCPTGSAMPLVWAHAEYLTLLRSVADGQMYDYLPDVAARYQAPGQRDTIEFWKPNRHAARVGYGFECLLIDAVPRAEWDAPMTHLVTEMAIRVIGHANGDA